MQVAANGRLGGHHGKAASRVGCLRSEASIGVSPFLDRIVCTAAHLARAEFNVVDPSADEAPAATWTG